MPYFAILDASGLYPVEREATCMAIALQYFDSPVHSWFTFRYMARFFFFWPSARARESI